MTGLRPSSVPRSRATGKLDPALVWEELRSILKGACLAPSQPMLGEEAYFELGKKRAPLFIDELTQETGLVTSELVPARAAEGD